MCSMGQWRKQGVNDALTVLRSGSCGTVRRGWCRPLSSYTCASCTCQPGFLSQYLPQMSSTCFLVPYSSISKALCPNNPFLFIKCLSQNTDNRHTAQTRCMGAQPHLPHHHRLLRGTHPHASVVLGSWALEPPENGLYDEWIWLSESPERPWNFFGLRIQKEKIPWA